MPLNLEYTFRTSIPVEVDGLLPAVTRNKSLDEIRRVTVQHGKERLPLADLFKVSGDPSDESIVLEGDLRGVHRIGEGLTHGLIHVRGDAGRHVGAQMTGGEVVLEGSAGDFLGTAMHGGRIHVRGSAGQAVGSVLPGHSKGMTGGVILVGGDVGDETGRGMRRGMIAVAGSAGEFTGSYMLAGSILVFGRCGARPGAGMRRGTIGLLGSEAPPLLPTFRRACSYRPPFLPLLLRHLRELRFSASEQLDAQTCDMYHGDMLELGRGEILARAA